MSRATAKAVQSDLFKHVPTQAEIGRQLKEQALDCIETAWSDWLAKARDTMAKVCLEKGQCTSDDCWELCPPPADAHHNIMGCLFRDRRFVRVSATQTKRASGRARWISVYELVREPSQEREHG